MAQRKKRLDKTASGRQHAAWGRSVLAAMDAHLTIDQEPEGHHLSDTQRAALAADQSIVQRLVQGLTTAVVPYRDFIDGAFVEVRAKGRVADFLVDEAQRAAEAALRPVREELAPVVSGGVGAFFGGFRMSRVLAAGRELTVKLARDGATLFRGLPADKFAFAPAVADRLDKAAHLLDRYFRIERDEIAPRRLPLRVAVDRAVNDLREGLEQVDGRLRTYFSQAFIDSLYPTLSGDSKRVADTEPDDGADGEADPAGSPPAAT